MRSRYARIVVAALVCAGCSSKPEEAPGSGSETEGSEHLPPPEPIATPAALEPSDSPAPPPPAPMPAANVAPKPQMPMLAAVVIHKVKDFDTWKREFDAHADVRKGASIVGEGVMRGADDDKLVVLYLPATDAAKLKEFSTSKELKDRMKAAGVSGKPTLYVFNSVVSKMAPRGATPGFGAVVQLTVKDFAAFQTAFEAQDDARKTAGITGYGLGQGVEKPTEADLYLQSDDAAKIKAYLDSKETKKAMKDAGVRSSSKATIVHEGTMTMY